MQWWSQNRMVVGCVGVGVCVLGGGDVGQQTTDFILVSVATQIKCYIM